MFLKEQLGLNIKKLRKSKKLTQEQLAEMINIDPKNVSRLEKGNNYPSPETLWSNANALEVDVYELFVFKDTLPYDDMRKELLEVMKDDKTVLYLYQMLKRC